MDDVGCLVEAIYFEARGEGVVGMIAVGQVILNRVNDERFPRDVCSVVHAGQYWNNTLFVTVVSLVTGVMVNLKDTIISMP
jgi:spore germination cell wall hydrolase CwlJ-like protein